MPIPIGGNTVTQRGGTGPKVLPPGRNWNAELALGCTSFSIRQCALLILREAAEKGIAYEAQARGNGKPAIALDCEGYMPVLLQRLDGYSAIVVSTPNKRLAQFISELSAWADWTS